MLPNGSRGSGRAEIRYKVFGVDGCRMELTKRTDDVERVEPEKNRVWSCGAPLRVGGWIFWFELKCDAIGY